VNLITREATGLRDTWRQARAGGTMTQLRFALIMLILAAGAGLLAWNVVIVAAKL
jgi:hypothetical protein